MHPEVSRASSRKEVSNYRMSGVEALIEPKMGRRCEQWRLAQIERVVKAFRCRGWGIGTECSRNIALKYSDGKAEASMKQKRVIT